MCMYAITFRCSVTDVFSHP
uniref:Uncharacterized protein n=1 Tax=Rhizophora mucronata TaxID=61149 RepID=A0A2P2R299_RHIMU